MSRKLLRLSPSLLLLAALPAAAEVPLDVIADTEIFIDGLFQADTNVFDSDVVQFKDDSEMRRAEVIFRGKHASGLELMLGYDPKADKWLDASVKGRLGAYTTWRVGQYKQPNSLEELGSTKNNDFIAKSMATNTFGIARRLGVELATEGRNWTATGSYFGRELTRNLARGNGYGGRFSWAPLLEQKADGNANFFHLGLSAVSHDTDIDALRLRARPGADLTPIRLVDTGVLNRSDRITSIGAEAAWVHGPFHLQGEYYQSKVDRYDTADFDANAWYVYGTWNITGEGLGYKQGVVVTPFPNEPLRGMWQIGLRYEGIDLDDGSVLGGEENNTTLGVNWYWRTNFKFMANYVQVDSERRGIEDNPNIVELRAQLMF
jgi:phosphate-selective porin OprO and OprP